MSLEVTGDRLLGGRLQYAQPVAGYRTGLEPVLLAASIPARAGESILEAGTGAGAGLLCLAARVPGISGLGLEIDPALAALARENFARNAAAGLGVEAADVTLWPSPRLFDHVFANPPWHAASGTLSPNAQRQRAKFAGNDTLGQWIGALARALRARGTLSLILPASQLGAAIERLMQQDCREIALQPIWPRQETPAKLLILRAMKGGRGPCRLNPGLILHEEGGGYTEAAERILRHGAALASN